MNLEGFVIVLVIALTLAVVLFFGTWLENMKLRSENSGLRQAVNLALEWWDDRYTAKNILVDAIKKGRGE